MVFVKKKEKAADPDLTVAAFTGIRTKKGHVGIEIEVEGARLPKGEPPYNYLGDFWQYKRDGSLRGEDSGEYVYQKPFEFDQVDASLDDLWKRFKDANTRLDVSNRTSVHVHLNVLPFYQNRLVSLMALWFTFEEILSHWCGDTRVGNLFCVRAKDGPAIITQLKNFVERKGQYNLNADALHYSAFNVGAIFEFGSVETRTLRGVTEPETVKEWVRILRRLYEYSDRYTDPRGLVEAFSMEGPMDFFRLVFGDQAEVILKGVNFTDEQFRLSLYEGIRYAQDLVYARDWSDFNPTTVREDPFGRKTKKAAPRTEQDEQPLDWEGVPPIAGRVTNDPFFMAEQMRQAVRRTTLPMTGTRIRTGLTGN
jgi:hypothetical protein